jgi:1-pyrroline-5-carboxylate dehydrogenase
MSNAIFRVPAPVNERVRDYAPGSPERASLVKRLAELRAQRLEIASVIGGRAAATGKLGKCVCPHEHDHTLATYHKAGRAEIDRAIESALAAKRDWEKLAWQDRAAIFLKAAELLAGPYRDTLNAATMLGQSKNAFQAEIDSACELIDFFRFNVHYLAQIYAEQPLYSPSPTWNRLEHRPLEGFVFAVTPFNFTSIAGNLPTAPAIMGNTVIWKPASSAVYSAHFIMELLAEAGLPPGVINLVLGSGSEVGNAVLAHPQFAGIHFTGSNAVFNSIWKTVGSSIGMYRTYPRMVGETGGKDFVFVDPSFSGPRAQEALITALVRGAFEYQGQKCSAASRAYVPRSIWQRMKDDFVAMVKSLPMGPPEEFPNFVNAVIDEGAFATIKGYVDHARGASDAAIIAGGACDATRGYYVAPTVIEARNPLFKTMEEEIFGPVLTVYAYDDADVGAALDLCDRTSPYALTGAVFASDRYAIVRATERLRHAAGNFYINDKPTGAVVGQQPFGGARGSGTNDKAGSMLNLLRWVSPRTIKENFVPPRDYRYPCMG